MYCYEAHHMPTGLRDDVAFAFVKLLRFLADLFFRKRFGHRAVVLETVAAVPGKVGRRDRNHEFADQLVAGISPNSLPISTQEERFS